MPIVKIGTTLKNRYCLIGVLGEGGSSITYSATDQLTNQPVAIKALSLRGISDWKTLELFEREAQTLAALKHPAIPEYIDYFFVDRAEDRDFYIVQAVAEGTSLGDRIKAGQHFSEPEVRQIAMQLLAVLMYLHKLNPPTIHRDIKPQNIILREDGQIFLIDFGAVQTVYKNTMAFGSTVVGTYGYMAPEQFRGQAVPATDLYGLGTTLLHLLTHQHPGDLPNTRLKIDFRSSVNVSSTFANWLETLIEPSSEDRYSSAGRALAALTRPTFTRRKRAPIRKPVIGPVQLEQDRESFSLKISSRQSRITSGILLFLALMSNVLFLPWTIAALAADSGFLFSLPFTILSLGLTAFAANELQHRLTLKMTGKRFVLERRLPFWQLSTAGLLTDSSAVSIETLPLLGNIEVSAVCLHVEDRQHRFGMLLTAAERVWLRDEIKTFIETYEATS